MTSATAAAIEDWLYKKGGWVSSSFICELFDVADRELRPSGNRAGLLDGFAISRNEKGGGYIHLDHATPEEVESWYYRKKNHGQAEVDSAEATFKKWQRGPIHRTAPFLQLDLLPQS